MILFKGALLKYMNIFSEQNIREHSDRICDLFGFSAIEDVKFLHEGYKAHNLIIRADGQRYFLKVYRRLGHVVQQIKHAEQFFSDQYVPVIRSMKDKYGREAFCLDREWCSLFPYVEDAIVLSSGDLTDLHIIKLGHLTARVHAIGAYGPASQFDHIYFWQHRYFHWEYEELMDVFRTKPSLNEMDRLVRDTLQEKQKLVASLKTETADLPSTHPVIIHGDLIYQNVFWNPDGEITHVFDFEKTCVAPRAYEFARSLMINCFDDTWDDAAFRRATIFLNAYREEIDFSFEEFLSGIRLYWANVVHMTWLEAKYTFGREAEPSKIYVHHANRIHNMHEDPEVFCLRIYTER